MLQLTPDEIVGAKRLMMRLAVATGIRYHVLQLPFHGECLTAASSVTARFAALGYGE
jgi:hypothetical protein